MSENRFQPITLAALLFMVLIAFALISDREQISASAAPDLPVLAPSPTPQATKAAPPQRDLAEIRAPYDDYILTQGPHGASYGHMAIDLTAGKGEAVLSPISGEVTSHYIDEYGNTTLVIENQFWQVILLHGDYTVSVADQVEIGQPVGQESNNGYTVDWRGRSCRGRDCGYHTHLNILDKRSGENVNPLEVLEH